MKIQIRHETRGDEPAIYAVTKVAFEGKAYASGTEASIIDQLRCNGDLTISLVAEDGCEAAGRVFDVSAATAVRFAPVQRTRGTVGAKRQGRPPGRFGKLAPHLDFLLDAVSAEPNITSKELAAALSETETDLAPGSRTRG